MTTATTTPTPNILDAALVYAERGWPVLPLHTIRDGRCTCRKAKCGSPGKHPWSGHGFTHGLKDATVDERIIRKWWKAHPDANVGVCTGEMSGIVVLDVDSYNGGEDSLADLEHDHGELPETVEAITGGGGRHLLFRHPRDGRPVPNRSGKSSLRVGLDFKGDDGYFVAEPSLHESSRRYYYELSHLPGEHPIADLPDWLLERVREQSAAAAGPTTDNGEAKRSTDDRVERCLQAMLVMQTRDGRDGSKRLYACACRCVEHNLTDDDAVAVSRLYAHLRPFPRRWSPDDFRQRLRDAERKVRRGEAVNTGRLVVQCLDDVEPEDLVALWPRRLFIGKYNGLNGIPDVGKSMVTMAMASSVSRGKPWPDSPDEDNPVGSVILLSAEDDLADTVRPRLDAAGADPRKVHAVKAVEEVDHSGARMFDLQRDLPSLADLIERLGDVRLVIVDPVDAYFGARIDGNSKMDVSRVLHPLADFAAKYHVAVVGVGHLNKTPNPRALHRVHGSIAFTAVARAVWLVAQVKGDPNADRRLFVKLKYNLGRPAPGLAFTIEDGAVRWLVDDDVTVTADDVLSEPQGNDAGERSKVDAACEFLREALSDGAQRATDVKAWAKENGIATRTLERAKADLKVVSDKTSGPKDVVWFWRLPDA